MPLPTPAFEDPKHHLKLYHADSLELLAQLPESSVDLIFADPPYFLSNGGITCHAGKMVSVHKGDWDKSQGPEANHAFNRQWLALCQRVLKPNASIWVSGTAHVIHSVGFAMQQLGFKLLNDISWVKPNPPPNLSCRYFTHATETIIWAAKNAKSRHTFNYKEMKLINHNKQMKSVWEISPRERQSPHWRSYAEIDRTPAKHPTQKPLALLERILLASTNEGDVVLDPFAGASTTLISALRLRRQAIGCELSIDFVTLSLRRICSNLVHANISVLTLHIPLGPQPISEDRSCSGGFVLTSSNAAQYTQLSFRAKRGICFSANSAANHAVSNQLQLVQQTRHFHFVGRINRQVIFSTEATSLDDARQKFQASCHSANDALFIIKTETEIYLA
jgi:site-specific DNA-methyltransferase (adenine-specific)